MLMTIIGVAVAQIDVNPTISLNNMVTFSCVCDSIVSPIMKVRTFIITLNKEVHEKTSNKKETYLTRVVLLFPVGKSDVVG